MVLLLIMTFQNNSIDWQFRKFYQRIEEWIWLQLSRWQPDLPDLPNPPNWDFPFWGLTVLFWLMVAAIVGWCCWQIVRMVMAYWPSKTWAELTSADRKPSNPPRSIADWLKAAQAFQQQRNYGEACRALYMAMIERLHNTQLIVNDESRTDGEYGQLVSQLPRSESYQMLLQTHEQLKFGNVIISAEKFQQCQQAYRAIEQGLST